MKRSCDPANEIRSERWAREQQHVNPCPKCGALSPVAHRLLQPMGSTYFLRCGRCKYHPKAVFSFSPQHGLKAALRRWNRAK